MNQMSVEECVGESGMYLSPYLLFRVNNLSTALLNSLQNKRILEYLREQAAQEEWIEQNRQAVIDILFELVTGMDDKKTSQALINLKRDIFNKRKSKVKREQVLHAIESYDLLMGFFDATERLDELLVMIESAYWDDMTRAREDLQQLAADADFLRSLALSSRDLFTRVHEYLSTPVASQKARLQKVEYSLIQYLARAATKTSPYSRYTSVAMGDWDGAEQQDALRIAEGPLTAMVKVHHVLIQRLLHAILIHPVIREILPYRMHQDMSVVDNKITFVSYEDNEAKQPRVFKTRHKQVTLGNNNAIQAVAQILSQSPSQSLRYDELVAVFRSSSNLDEAKVRGFLNQLIDHDILETAIEIPDQTEEILEDAIKLLASLDHAFADAFVQRLQAIRELMLSLAEAEGTERVKILGRMDKGFREVFEMAGAPSNDNRYKVMLYEDCALPMEGTSFSEKSWDETLQNMRHLLQIAPLFDPYIRLQATMTKLFVEKFGVGGRCNDLAEIDAIAKEITETFQSDAKPSKLTYDTGMDIPEIEKLQELRLDFINAMIGKLKDHPDQVNLDAELLHSFAQQIPPRLLENWATYALFVQLQQPEGHEPMAVVNHMYNGLGQFISRFLPLFDDSWTERIRTHIRDFFPNEQQLVEMRAAFGFNANLHPPLTEKELAAAEIKSDRKAEEKVDWSELALMHDVETDRVVLVHQTSGQQMHLLYFGFLIPFMIPQRISFLLTLEGNSQTHIPLHIHAESALSDEEKREIRIYPRVTVGNVVLFRKKWYIPRSHIPQRDVQEEEWQYMVRLIKWSEGLGMPLQVFHKFVPLFIDMKNVDDESTIVSELQSEAYTNSFKPQFLDFSNPFLVRLFRKSLQDHSYDLIIEEMLPSMAGQAVESTNGKHVSEVVIEFNRRAQSGGHA